MHPKIFAIWPFQSIELAGLTEGNWHSWVWGCMRELDIIFSITIVVDKAFALAGRHPRFVIYPGCCPSNPGCCPSNPGCCPGLISRWPYRPLDANGLFLLAYSGSFLVVIRPFGRADGHKVRPYSSTGPLGVRNYMK